MSPSARRRPPSSTGLVGLFAAFLVPLFVAQVGCFPPRELPAPIVVPAPAQATPDELRWAVEASLAERRWTILERAPGRINAYVHSEGGGDEALIELTYASGAVNIRCVKFGGNEFRYDRWVHLLSADIQKNVAQIGMGRGGPPPAPTTP